VSRSLALDANSRAAEDRDGETGKAAKVEIHADRISSPRLGHERPRVTLPMRVRRPRRL
jgi:hypothetical protein